MMRRRKKKNERVRDGEKREQERQLVESYFLDKEISPVLKDRLKPYSICFIYRDI